MGTEQVLRMLLAVFEMGLYFQKDERTVFRFCHVLVNNLPSVRFMNCASFVQKHLELPSIKKSAMAQALSWSSAFKVQLFFPAFMFLENYIQKKQLSTWRN